MDVSSVSATSWGRFPYHPQTLHPCHWREDIPTNLSHLIDAHKVTLPFGNGRSYGDSCLASSDHVLHTQFLDRFLMTDWEKGVVIAESGVTLEKLLMLSIPQGWFLPVTPGTKYVTLGGALANDVHGKNHHLRGTFGCHVHKFCLTRSDGPPLICSQEENTDLFKATIGGLGLTGVIEWVSVQLMPIQSSYIDATYIRFDSLREFFSLSKEYDATHEYTVAWIDCLAKGSAVGRGVFMAGNHAPGDKHAFTSQRKINIPFTLPVSPINHLTLRLFNSVFYRSHKAEQQHRLVNYDPFFYPLDRLSNWNRLYGPRGFQQYQCVLPHHTAELAMGELLQRIASAGKGSFLAVLKCFGNTTSPGFLSFPMPGVSLALDFPQDKKLTTLLFPYLDSIVRQAGGRLYPAKDAHMSGKDFRNFYPAWEQIEALRDPALCSRFWERVTKQ